MSASEQLLGEMRPNKPRAASHKIRRHFSSRLPIRYLSNGNATNTVVIGGAGCRKKWRQPVCNRSERMLLLVVLAIVVCSFVAWLLLHLGVEVVQALLALAMMTITWHLLRRRPNMTIADEFKNW